MPEFILKRPWVFALLVALISTLLTLVVNRKYIDFRVNETKIEMTDLIHEEIENRDTIIMPIMIEIRDILKNRSNE